MQWGSEEQTSLVQNKFVHWMVLYSSHVLNSKLIDRCLWGKKFGNGILMTYNVNVWYNNDPYNDPRDVINDNHLSNGHLWRYNNVMRL